MRISECIQKLELIKNVEGDIEIGHDTGYDYAFLEAITPTTYYPGDGSEMPIVSMHFTYDK